MKTILAGLILMVCGVACGQCESIMPGTSPAVYKITFSTGRVVMVSQPRPTPAGASPCLWSALKPEGAYAVWHSQDIAGGPFGGLIVVGAVRLGIPDGMNMTWKANYTASPRNGAGPFTFDIGNGVTATVTVGP